MRALGEGGGGQRDASGNERTLSERWEVLFDELVELDEETRGQRLARIGEQEPSLAARLRALLAADAATKAGALDTPLGQRAPEFVAASFDSDLETRSQRDRSGERLGPYRLLRLLGRGGMAEVYLAERADGEFEQRVAVKRILPGLGSEAIHERFLRERQILAQLEHPGIARLLDGGRSEDGQPFFVLELVVGLPITDYCAARDGRPAATLEQRLRLVLAVCEAVELAHQRLVVHRDLKPSNILVAADGRVKLLDFGIAKLLADDSPQGLTRLEGSAFTPAYAAPEQILGKPITTATDVFALGILLFELLTDRKPYARDEVSLPALARAVEGEIVERPSTTVRRGAEAAGSSRPEAERRARRLTGDLDTIVAKALAAEPARRYASAAALAEDLRRYLERRPILARADSLRYRMARFVARHRLTVAASALVALSLVGGLALALWQAAVARHETARAERVRDFLVALFREADPSRTRGATITAREILDAGARRVTHDLAAEPSIEAELLDAIAQVERSLGLPAAAKAHAERSLAVRRWVLGEDDPATAASRLTHAEALYDLGDLVGARRELDRAAPLSGDPARGGRYDELRINLLSQSGQDAKAVVAAQRRLGEILATQGEGSLEAARARLLLSNLLVDSSRIGEAVTMERAAVATLDRTVGAGGLERALAQRELAETLQSAGERKEALARFASALALQRTVLGPRHPEVAFTEIPYGYALSESRHYDEAEAVLADAISILRPLGHYELASAVRYLGFAQQARGHFVEAERSFAEAAAIYAAKLGNDHPDTRAARLSHAWILARLDRLPEAETALRAVAADLERSEGPRSNSLRVALKYLGEVRRRRGDPSEALALHHRARSIELAVFGTTRHIGVAASDLQVVLDRLARPDVAGLAEARRLADEGIALFRALDPEEPRLDELLVASGRVALAQHDLARARADLGEAAQRLERRLGTAHPDVVAVRQLLAAAPPAAS